jgi:hypothetical protein
LLRLLALLPRMLLAPSLRNSSLRSTLHSGCIPSSSSSFASKMPL